MNQLGNNGVTGVDNLEFIGISSIIQCPLLVGLPSVIIQSSLTGDQFSPCHGQWYGVLLYELPWAENFQVISENRSFI